MAITAWSAKVSRSLICAGVKGRTSMRRATQHSDESPLLTKGNTRKVRNPLTEPSIGKSFCARTSGTWSVPCSRIQRNRGSSILISTRAIGYRTKMSPRNHSVALVESQPHVINPTDPRCALDNGIKHRLHVRGRAADDAQHFRGRGLMLQRFAQFRVALLEFFE